ncbi:MAG: glycosyltransferase family 4 protein [Patescibacteria group bacterium]
MKPILAILTEAIRFDNQAALKFFRQFSVIHFYKSAPYHDLSAKDLQGAIQYQNTADLEAKLCRLKPDIIQGAEPYGSRNQLKLCSVAWRVSRKLKIPLIFPMLENRPVNRRFGILGPILRKILYIYAQQAKIIFYLNEGAKRNLLDAGVNPKKLKRLLYGIWGIDTSIFKPINTPLRGRGENKVRSILFVGRIDEAKGIDYLLQAWEQIYQDFPQIELLFAGSGPLVWKVKKSQNKRVRYLGQIATQELPKIYSGALITCYPSVTLERWEEQVGMVNLQSLSCGTPVITTKSGAIPEYINDKVGILIPERDASALARAMRKLLEDEKLRARLGPAGREYILKNFGAQRTIQKTEEILLGLLR